MTNATNPGPTELERLLVSLCAVAKRDGVCFSGERVTRLINAVRDEGRAEAKSVLAQQTARLDLATEFRVPLPDGLGGYGEVVVQRESSDCHRFAVTDGAVSGMCVWLPDADGWTYIGDCGRAAAYCYGLDEALAVAERVAERERASIAERIRRGAGEGA